MKHDQHVHSLTGNGQIATYELLILLVLFLVAPLLLVLVRLVVTILLPCFDLTVEGRVQG